MGLFLAPPFDRLWQGKDPFTAVEYLEGPVFRALEARRTLCTEIAGQRFFVKIHRGIGWGEIFKNLFSGRLPVFGAGNEWKALCRLHDLGVPTMRAVAFGCRGWNPARRHSFIITENLGDTVSLEDFTAIWQKKPPPARIKRALVAEVARMAGAMHRGGVNHRDFYLCHFLMQKDPSPEKPHLSLIDLHRAQVRSKVPRRWRDKDLAGLYFSALKIGLTKRDKLRFLRIYFNRPLGEILLAEGGLLQKLEAQAQRLSERFRRKYLSGTDN